MNDDLENLITQSLDGLLSPEQQADLDTQLARNAAARQMRDEYAALGAALKQSPLPNLNFDRLAQHISQAIEESDAPAPVYIFPAWSRWSAGIAAAACIVFSFTIWGHRAAPPAPIAITPSPSSTHVAIMDAGFPINSQPIAALSIGPQPGGVKITPAGEALNAPRSAVAIDSAAVPAQDTDRPLY